MSPANRLTRRRRRIVVHPDGIQVGVDGRQRAVLAVGGVYHDTQSDDERDQTAAAAAALVASLLPKQEVQLLVRSNPLDRDHLLAQVAAETAACPPPLQPYRAGNRAWWTDELRDCHQARRDFYAVVSPLPARHAPGSPGERAALDAAVRGATRHLTNMGVDTARLDGPAVAALLARSLPAAPGHGPSSLSERSLPTSFIVLWEGKIASVARILTSKRPPSALSSEKTRSLRQTASGVVTFDVPDLTGDEERAHVVLPDGTLARTIYLLAPPPETDPGWTQALVGAEVPYTLVVTLRGLDQERERKGAARRDRYLGDQVAVSRHVTTDVEEARREARDEARMLRERRHTLAHVGVYVTVTAPDVPTLDERAETVASILAVSSSVAQAQGHQEPLYLATRPIGWDKARSVYRMYAETVGNGMPYHLRSPGTARGMLVGYTPEGRETVLLDWADPSLRNALMCITGGSGSGKTVLAQFLATHMLQTGGRVTVIDSTDHYDTTRRVVGGVRARLGPRSPVALNIWDRAGIDPDDEDLREEKIAFVCDAHEVLLAAIPGGYEGFPSAVIDEGVRAVYAAHPDGSSPLERELVEWLTVQAEDTARWKEHQRVALSDMAYHLRPYTHNNRYGGLVDRPTSPALDLDAPFLQFDLRDLRPRTPAHAFAMFAVAETVKRRALREVEAQGRDADAEDDAERMSELLIIDEGWHVVKYQGAGEWIETLARKGRHWGLVLAFITQQVSDLTEDPAAAALFNQASIQILFRQKDRGKKGGAQQALDWLAGTLDLTGHEVAKLKNLKSERGAFSDLFLIRETKAGQAAHGAVRFPSTRHHYWMTASYKSERIKRDRMIAAVARDRANPTQEEVWAAVDALAQGKTPEQMTIVTAAAAPARAQGGAQVCAAR